MISEALKAVIHEDQRIHEICPPGVDLDDPAVIAHCEKVSSMINSLGPEDRECWDNMMQAKLEEIARNQLREDLKNLLEWCPNAVIINMK